LFSVFGSSTSLYENKENNILFIIFQCYDKLSFIYLLTYLSIYEGRSESKERFVIQRYLLIIEKKKNMQVLSHTFTYFST